MFDKLSSFEKTAFKMIADILKEKNVERHHLRVMIAARSGDLTWALIKFRELGLIQEIKERPSLMRRLIGDTPKSLLALTEVGRTTLEIIKGEEEQQTVAFPALVGSNSVIKAPEKSVVRRRPPSAKVAIPKRVIRLEAKNPTESVKTTAASQALVPLNSITEVAQASISPKRPLFAATDYTEVLGGEPVATQVSTHRSDRLEGLTELLSLTGFEITRTGELLAEKRWSENVSDAEIALEIMLLAVAHASRLHQNGTARLDATSMLDVIESVQKVLETWASENKLNKEQVSQCLQLMQELVKDGQKAAAIVEELLADPLRGMAPPALCPD